MVVWQERFESSSAETNKTSVFEKEKGKSKRPPASTQNADNPLRCHISKGMKESSHQCLTSDVAPERIQPKTAAPDIGCIKVSKLNCFKMKD